MTVVGFDFGTTNSLVAVVSGNRALPLLEDGLPVPSVVCYEGAETIAGRDAKNRLDSAGLGVYGNIVRSPKVLLDQESVHVGGVERRPPDIVRDVVRFVKDEAIGSYPKVDLGGLERAVVTIPVHMDGKQRTALRDAFAQAGISIVQFIHEPFAALYGLLRSRTSPEDWLREYDRKLILVVDWGGGTLDLTLCCLQSGSLVQLANTGSAEVGGDKFDEAIRSEVIARSWKESDTPEDATIHPDAKTRLLHQCEEAKIDLSDRASYAIYVPSFFDHEEGHLDYSLDRAELESITGRLVKKGAELIDGLLERTGIAPSQVGLCVATGGMVGMPAVQARLHELFGPERVMATDSGSTLAAEGAAWVANDRAPLSLAKTVELKLARNSFLPLIPAGTQMPTGGTVKDWGPYHLYCADPRDGIAKFEITMPERPGRQVPRSELREPVANAAVEVDRAAKPLRERLELDVRVDENLILTAQGRSLNQQDSCRIEVYDLEFGLELPWEFGRSEGEGLGGSDKPSDVAGTTAVSSYGQTHHAGGDLVVRSNIVHQADENKEYSVPGELLYEYHRMYFDRRFAPPQEQVEEYLYYRPCAVCGRASNDPLCRCSSSAKTTLI